jgi:hypothetical protein
MGWAHIFMHSNPLLLSSSLCVKGLTRRCYGWNKKGNILTLTQLNNQHLTNPSTSLPLLGHLGLNHNYDKATNMLGYWRDIGPVCFRCTQMRVEIKRWRGKSWFLLCCRFLSFSCRQQSHVSENQRKCDAFGGIFSLSHFSSPKHS